MGNARDYVTCAVCGTPIDEDPGTALAERKPCPVCGSTARNYNVSVRLSTIRGWLLGLKHKRPGHKKPVYESKSGDELYRDTGQWHKISREIDRENNRYRERIVDPKTGEVIRECDEPLTEHQGRGSAKRKQNPPRSDQDT